MFLFFLSLFCTLLVPLDGFIPFRAYKLPLYECTTSRIVARTPRASLAMALLKRPESIQAMMAEAGRSVIAYAKEGGDETKICSVEVPIPVTGGTELDDWPGGIRQKYSVLRSMTMEMMKVMNFGLKAKPQFTIGAHYVNGKTIFKMISQLLMIWERVF